MGMGMGMKSLVSLALALSAFSAFAQGSAAGYGQGFGGGAGGGFDESGRRTGFRPDGKTNVPYNPVDNAIVAAPHEDLFWMQKAMVLSPGDKVEWKIDAKAGQILMAKADSDAFDPAIVVEDPKGKVLIQNDDREEGDQSPFIIVRCPADGVYKLRVVSFRNNAGGRFNMRMRQFYAQDIQPGETKTPNMLVERVDDGRVAIWTRYRAKKGEVIAMQTMFFANEGCGLRSVIGPTGTPADATDVPLPGQDRAFRANQDGDYYAEWHASGPKSGEVRTTISLVTQLKGTNDERREIKLQPHERAIVEIPFTAGVPTRTTLTYPDEAVQYAYFVPSGRKDSPIDTAETDGSWWTTQTLATFRLKNGDHKDLIRIFKREGTAIVGLVNSSDKPQTFAYANTTKLDSWTNGPVVTDKLGIAESKYYILDSSKSDLKKVWTKTSAFEMQLDIFNMQGDLANSMIDLKNHSPSDDLYFPNAGKFLVRISCVGNGGSGEFQLRQDSTLPTAYASAAPGTVKLTGENFGLYAVELKKGVRYEVVLEDQDSACSVDLLDDEGTFLSSPTIRFGAMRAFYFTPVRDGRHRLWIRGRPGDYKFVLRPHADPKIG